MITINIQVDGSLNDRLRHWRKRLRNRRSLIVLASLLSVIPVVAVASPVTIPNTFTSGTVISSSEMNANFTAVATAINDNDTAIADNATAISDNNTRITALEAESSPTNCNWAVLDLTSTAWASLTAHCTGSQYVISGGCLTSSSYNLVSSRPNPLPDNGDPISNATGWFCAFSGSSTLHHAYALCCD